MKILYATLFAHWTLLAAAQETNYPDPNIDPFYQAPANVSSYAPGQVIRSRQVVSDITDRTIASYQLFYRTIDNKNDAIGTVATIWVPVTPLSPSKVFSFPQAEDALNLDCAPSWAFVNASSSLASGYFSSAYSIVNWSLAQGYYVVIPDQEGPDSAWLVGLTEGRATLDAIRAASTFLSLPCDQTDVGILGYSGGGHTVAWASSLAEQYAPELKIVGAAFGGTPVDLEPTLELLNGSPSVALAIGTLAGLANGYPALNERFNSLLTSDGAAVFARLRAPCLGPAPDYAGVNFISLFTENPLDDPVLLDVLARESLLSNVSNVGVPVPKFPRFEWHGTNDHIVAYGPEAAYVEQQCAGGADIRFFPIDGLDHGDAAWAAVPSALSFLQQAFAGTLTKVPCGSNSTT